MFLRLVTLLVTFLLWECLILTLWALLSPEYWGNSPEFPGIPWVPLLFHQARRNIVKVIWFLACCFLSDVSFSLCLRGGLCGIATGSCGWSIVYRLPYHFCCLRFGAAHSIARAACCAKLLLCWCSGLVRIAHWRNLFWFWHQLYYCCCCFSKMLLMVNGQEWPSFLWMQIVFLTQFEFSFALS